MAGSLPIAILVAGGGAVIAYVGIVDPPNGLMGEIGRVLRGEPSSPRAAQTSTVSTIAASFLTPAASSGPGTSAQPAGAAGGGAGSAVVSAAAQQLGVRYAWGGANPGSGFDCSGLTQWAYQQGAGIDITRTTYTQVTQGQSISADQAQPGDLVFFGLPPSHVGIVTGPGEMIHAPHTGDVVRYAPISSIGVQPITYRRILGSSASGMAT
jgi:cell wall-associated NlpC family hydrolase